MMNTTGGSSRVHEAVNPGTHKYRVKHTITPAIRVKVARNRRYKKYGSSQHKSY